MSLLIQHFYRFAEFTVDTDQRVLLREGKPVPLTPKVFDTLLILLESNGRIVEKEELMNGLWPETFVEEANLTFNIKQLRKSLGDDARRPVYIETVARRGYRFIANVEEVLSERSVMREQIIPRLETRDAESRVTGNALKREKEGQKPEPHATLASEKKLPIPASSFDAGSTAGSDSTSVVKRPVALAAAVLILVASVGFVVWRLSNGSNNNPNESKRSDGRPAALPLKVEKLTGTGQSHYVAISPDGKYLAYTIGIERNQSIWLRQLATNTNVEIVRANGIVYGLAFANSGEYLYFVRGNPTALYRVSLLGGVPAKTVDHLEGKFSISSDDRRVAFVRQVINRDGQQEFSLIIANSDGTDERTLVAETYPDKLDAPLWSPGGESIICAYGSSTSGSQEVTIVGVRVTDGMKKNLSSDRFFHITKMAWLPDKSGLIMSAAKNYADVTQLWRVSYPSMEISQITEGFIGYADLSLAANADKAVASDTTHISDIWVGSGHEPQNLKRITEAIDNFCWTPNGQLVYSSRASGNADLWIMRPDGTEQRQLTVNAAVNDTPAITSDNRYIVFISNRTGSFQVWRMNIDGSNQVQLTNGGGKNFPSMSSDGKWVLYNSTDDWHLWKVSIEGGEPLPHTEYPAFFPSVSPDGKLIACVGRKEAKRELLVLPFEGGQPVKKIDFAGWGFSGTRIRWTPDGKALLYAAERDGSTAIVKRSLDGGLPKKLADFGDEELLDFGYSSDGGFLAVTRGGWQHDIVLISDLNRY